MTADARSDATTAAPATTARGRIGAGISLATGLIPLGLVVLAEAAWVSVLGALVQEMYLRSPAADLGVLVAFVIVGLLVSRAAGLRLGARWPLVALTLSVVAAFAGVLVSGDAREIVARDGIGAAAQALGANPGGLLAGVAFLRGVSWGHTGLPLPEDRLIRLLGGGIIGVTLAAVAGSLVVDPWRSEFLADALGAGLVFGASAIVALALTRQAIAAGDVAAAWQRNPVWVVSLILLVASAAGIALAAAGQVRPALELMIGVAAIPIIILGLIGGWSRRTFRVFFALVGGFAILGAVGSAVDRARQALGGGQNGVGFNASPVDSAVAAGAAALIALVIIVVVLLLVRVWMRQFRIDRENPIEERYVDRSDEGEAQPRRAFRLPFGRQPVDAVGAYRALVSDLAEREGVRREPWETPHEHATRLRASEEGGLPLDLLAADYALATFGGVRLSAGENRRAISRWKLLRRRLRAHPEALEGELGPDAL